MVRATFGSRPTLNVLVAEDNPQDIALLEMAVRRDGVNVHLKHVDDGTEVINYLRGVGHFANRYAFPMPDIILLDLKMQRLSGFDVLHWMRDNPECGKIPTVILSGSGLEKDVEKAYELGAKTYFEKPTSFKDFKALIQVLVQYWARSKRPHCPVHC